MRTTRRPCPADGQAGGRPAQRGDWQRPEQHPPDTAAGCRPGSIVFPRCDRWAPPPHARQLRSAAAPPQQERQRKVTRDRQAEFSGMYHAESSRRARPQRTAQPHKARPPGERENPVIARPRSAPTAAELAAGGKPARGRPGRRAAHRAAVRGLAHHRKNHLRDPTDGTASPAPDAVMATHPCHFCHAPFHVLTDACHSAARCSNSGPAARAADM